MDKQTKVIALAFFCVSCGGKPTPQANANLAAQTPPTVTSTSHTSAHTQQGATQPPARIQVGVFAVQVTAEAPKPPIAHEAVATIPGAHKIVYAVASPKTEEIFVLAQMGTVTVGRRQAASPMRFWMATLR